MSFLSARAPVRAADRGRRDAAAAAITTTDAAEAAGNAVVWTVAAREDADNVEEEVVRTGEAFRFC